MISFLSAQPSFLRLCCVLHGRPTISLPLERRRRSVYNNSIDLTITPERDIRNISSGTLPTVCIWSITTWSLKSQVLTCTAKARGTLSEKCSNSPRVLGTCSFKRILSGSHGLGCFTICSLLIRGYILRSVYSLERDRQNEWKTQKGWSMTTWKKVRVVDPGKSEPRDDVHPRKPLDHCESEEKHE